MQAKLPRFFSFKPAKDLVRLGRDNDGGYLVSQSDIEKSDALIGLGINDDWSFEEDFVSRRDVEVYAYDASVGQKYFLRQLIIRIYNFNASKIVHWIKTMLRYRKFFSKSSNHHHIKKFIGLNSNRSVDCALATVFDELNHQNIFMKIDVEGSEYRFLDTLITNQNRLSGMVLELHDCDVHLDTIRNFIDKFDLKLIHIHANNNSQIRLDDGLPLAMELTFSKHCQFQNEASLPHALDMPNDKRLPEIRLIVES